MLSFIGIKGSAQAGMIFLAEEYNQKKQTGLIKIDNKHVDELKASLTLVKTIENDQVIIRSLGASGTIKQAKGKYLAS